MGLGRAGRGDGEDAGEIAVQLDPQAIRRWGQNDAADQRPDQLSGAGARLFLLQGLMQGGNPLPINQRHARVKNRWRVFG
ncbi:hypothetical protein [Nitrospirillum pindoramense]|uniref:hypothetical protein n=1 Tax=Nitrospirillum amazonense TaxID=28077 RepID=UPI003B8A6463